MSVQSEFFEALLTELKARGLSDEVAEENVSKFKSQLSERAENEDYINDALSKIPPASIAENIYNMLRAETDEDAGAKSEVMVIDTESDTVETTIKEGKDAMSPLSEEQDAADPSEEAVEESDASNITEEIDVDFGDEVKDDEISDPTEEPTPVTDDTVVTDDDFVYSEGADDIKSFDEAENATQNFEETAEATTESEDADDDVSVYSPTSKRRINDSKKHSSENSGDKKPVRLTSETVDLFFDEEESKNSWLFIVMAIFIIPLFCVIGAAAFAVILGLWVGLAVVIAVLLLALAAIVVAGTAYAVMGLIFGIIEAFSGNAAAALFEVGLALCVGGIVMFIGIWVYNFAIRFIPFIIKKLGVLLILIFKLFKNALIKLKALCRKI